MSKRKRNTLSLKDKINIIESLNKGESGRMLAAMYGVSSSTISDIKKKKKLVLEFKSKLDSKAVTSCRKSMKKPKNELLEEALHCWYLQRRSIGKPITGPLLCQKALDFNMKLDGDVSFVASNGWLQNFKSRHGIRDLSLQCQKKVSDLNSERRFNEGFEKFLEDNKYDLDLVYNAAETGLNWKSLPSKSLIYQEENLVQDDRVTVLVCANASGTHRLPLVLVSKTKCFENIKIPLIYKTQKNAWMDSEIFTDWYNNYFIPEVKKFQHENGKQGNTLLLLDKAPAHSSRDLIRRENETFTVQYLPLNNTKLLPPININFIETFKLLYRKKLLNKLLSLYENNIKQALPVYEQINLKECCYMAVEAWNSIESKILSNAWNKILKRDLENTSHNTGDTSLNEIVDLIKKLSLCKECDEEDVKTWLESDSSDHGFQIMSEDEIIKNLQTEERISYEQDIPVDIEFKDIDNIEPTPEDAYEALETAFKWFEKQPECDEASLLQLKRIKDLAEKKKGNSAYNLRNKQNKKQ